MTALAADSPIKGPCIGNGSFPLLASAHPYVGSALGESAGYARPLVAGDKFLGHSLKNITNTAVNGANNVEALVGRYTLEVTLSGVAVTDLHRRVYMSDDATYTFVGNGNSYVGRVKEYVTTNTALVEFDTSGEGNDSRLAGVNVADSAAVGASSTDAAAFDKTVVIPVENLKKGDILRIRGSVQHTGSNTGHTLTVACKVATETVISSGALTIAAQNDKVIFQADVVIRAIGASGKLQATGLVFSILNATKAVSAVGETGEVSEDISGDVTISVTAQYGTSNAANTAVLKHLSVEHLHAL